MTQNRPLAAGLHIVSTPIGSARDITLRALDILRDADVIAAEDTRNTRKLMEIHSIALGGRPLIAYHDHNGPAQRPKLLALLKEGKSVAYVSDAGTPLVADPGFTLARAAVEEDLPVWSAPGPSALLAALVVAGLPTDRFLFAGFAPPSDGARRKFLRDLAQTPATLVFFEAPGRVSRMISSCVKELGADRQAAVCRELTKKFEEVKRGTLADLEAIFLAKPPKGEVVIVIDRDRGSAGEGDIAEALGAVLSSMSVKDAAREVAEALNVPRREVYQLALKMEKEK